MNNVRILLASESPALYTELQSGFAALKSKVQLLHTKTFDEFLYACLNNPFSVVLVDVQAFPAPFAEIMTQMRKTRQACAVYALFGQLDESAITAAIHAGASSFALKSNLDGLLHQIEAQSPVSLEPEAEVNLQYILKGFLAESTDSIWVKNRNGKYLLINQAGAKFLSKTIDDIIGKTDYEVFPPAAADKITKSDLEIMHSGITQTIEDKLITHDGKKRTFMAVKSVWRDERNEVAGVIGTVRDITGRKQAEETLQESEERFRRMVEGVKDHAIYMLDTRGLVNSWNIGAERLQGYRATDILGCHFSCFYVQDSGFHPEEALLQATEEGYHEQECLQVRKNGTRYWAKIIITPLFNSQKALIGFSSVVRDMTEQRQAEEALRRYAAKLEQSNQELEQFAMIASHDLQAPLRKVRLFSEMLEEHTGAEGKDIAKRLQASAEKMQHFISDLLELSRINRKGRPFKPVDMNEVIARVTEDLEVNISESHATLNIDSLGEVYGDQPQLEQLCLNLLGNSLKFRQPGTTPQIKVKGEPLLNGFYQLTIQDNGIGFKEEYLDKIFRPFERLHGPVHFPGTGMGLAICKKIVERHGGQITATSQEGQGATFIIYLPVAPKSENEAQPATKQPDRTEQPGWRAAPSNG